MITSFEKVVGMGLYFIKYENSLSSCLWCLNAEENYASPMLETSPDYQGLEKGNVALVTIPDLHQVYVTGLTHALQEAAEERENPEEENFLSSMQKGMASLYKKSAEAVGMDDEHPELDDFCPMTTTSDTHGMRYVTNGNGFVTSITYMRRSAQGRVVDFDGKQVRTLKNLSGPHGRIPANTEATVKVMGELLMFHRGSQSLGFIATKDLIENDNFVFI